MTTPLCYAAVQAFIYRQYEFLLVFVLQKVPFNFNLMRDLKLPQISGKCCFMIVMKHRKFSFNCPSRSMNKSVRAFIARATKLDLFKRGFYTAAMLHDRNNRLFSCGEKKNHSCEKYFHCSNIVAVQNLSGSSEYH